MTENPLKTETEPELTASATDAPGTSSAPLRATPLFVGITGAVDPDQLRALGGAIAASGALPGTHLTLAYPGAENARTAIDETAELLSYPLTTAEGATSPWAQTSAAEAALLALASEAGAQTTVLLHPDLQALTPESLGQLARPVLARQADLVMGSYTLPPFDGLLNHSLLAPLTRALYGKRVRFPLAPDFAVSARMTARLAMSTHTRSVGGATPILWPATVAASLDASVFEAHLDIQHARPGADMELSAILSQLVGSAFAEMEAHAPLWQRIRPALNGVQHLPEIQPGRAAAAAAEIDTAPMVKSFLLGSRSLQDIWGLLLPPVTLLDLKRLAQLTPDKFRMPDELWVRIVYDFALGYRLRTINRTHLLGALTPLYLGWAASVVNEATENPAFDPQARREKVARAFEDGKPYLVRRWRWPDRFNP